MNGDDHVQAVPGEHGGGQANVILYSKGDNLPGGVSGFQYSISHTENIDVYSVLVDPSMSDAIPALGRVQFASFDFSPIGVDPNEIYMGDDPECELTPGEPQGPGILADVTFGIAEEPSHNLPATTTISTIQLSFEQAEPFASLDDDSFVGGFFWRDCHRGSGDPVKTRIQVRGESVVPNRRDPHAITFEVVPPLQVPGDLNQDGFLDLTDSINLLQILFVGIPIPLPCGDGSFDAPGNLKLLDWQPDGGIDLTDVILTLSFLFLGEALHWMAVPGMETTGCVAIDGCDANPNCSEAP
jgi:hypothetical protein